MGPQDHRPDPGRRIALFLAIGVHVLLGLFLFFGVRWSTQHPEPMVAELWSELPKVQPPRPVQPEPKPEPPKPEPMPEPPKPEQKPEPKPEPKVEEKKPDIALEQEKKRKEEQKKKEAAEQREKDRKAKEEAERKKEEARKKAEKEKADREFRQQMARDAHQRMLAQLGEAVPDAPPSSAPIVGKPNQGDPNARAGYVDKIRAKIRSNIVLPPGIPGNPEAQFDVQQLPTGEVINVRLRKSSGVKSYDDAVERAIWKSSPLPKPDRAELFERTLNLKFRPLDD